MTKIGSFQIGKGRVGDFVNTINEIASYHTDIITTIGTHVSFLFNIINIMKLISRLVIPYYARRQIES